MMDQILSWGIVGTGAIAQLFADALINSKTGKLLAVASRTQEAASHFGKTWNVPRCYATYEQLLNDKDIQVVYIALPNSLHSQWAIKATYAGKHVVCEKPLGLNYIEAKAIVEAAQHNNVFLMEAFMYRFHPQTAKLVELIRAGVIGEVKMIQAIFSIMSDQNPEGRLLNNALGGGSILDVGCYCTSFARLIAGAALQKDFAEPTLVTGVGYLGHTNVDEYATASLKFPAGIIAQVFCGIQVSVGASATIYGSEGSISVPWPFFTAFQGECMALIIKRNDEKELRVINTETEIGLYTLEIDAIEKHITEQQASEISLEDTLGNMKTLDKWRAAVGVIYETDETDTTILVVNETRAT